MNAAANLLSLGYMLLALFLLSASELRYQLWLASQTYSFFVVVLRVRHRIIVHSHRPI